MNSDKKQIFWVDGLKAFAIIGILLNHFIESFGSYPWFSSPSFDWPDLATRMTTIFPVNGSLGWRVVQFLGYLGDMGPGVFVLVSGFTITMSVLKKGEQEINYVDFYRRRLLRIFPLYITIHVLILIIGAILHKGPSLTSPAVFMSILGLRFTDQLFYFINPSWWFIWLILQLYIVFPILYRLLIKNGIKKFIIFTLGFTFFSRLAGLLDFTWSDILGNWMTGLFFGTRLAEFAAGMIIAKLITEKRFVLENINKSRLFLICLAIYLMGFFASLFYAGTIISHLFITLGLSGILLTISIFIESNMPSLKKTLSWMGVVSFPVFLLHQPLMSWAGSGISGVSKGMIEACVLLLAFPTGRLIERGINTTLSFIPKIKDKLIISMVLIVISVQLIINLAYFITGNNLLRRADIVVFTLNLFFISLWFLTVNKITNKKLQTILLIFIPVSLLFMYVLTPNWFGIYWIFFLILLAGVLVVSLITRSKFLRLAVPAILIMLITLIAEVWLNKNHPMEVNKWGELPALQKDSLTVYSLIPGKVTHLRYNNYDYYTNTNTMGFNGPEVNLIKKDSNEIRILLIGDAFTMPEGLVFEKAWPELLQSNMQRVCPNKNIKVFNAAVTGFGPNEEYPQLVKYLDTLKPDIYINELFINEFHEIDIGSESRLNSIGLRPFSIREKLFAGWQVPEQLSHVLHKVMNDKQYKDYTYQKSLAYYYERRSNLYSNETVNKINDYIGRSKSLCEEKECQYIILYAPGQLEISSPENVEYYPIHINLNDSANFNLDLPKEIYRNLCIKNDVSFIDPSNALKENTIQPVYFRESWHWNEEGHKVIASYLAGEILKYIELNSK